MKKIVIAVLILMALQMHAQTGIGTTTPNASAKLDVYSTNKGFLPPRVTLASVSDATTITSPAEGLLVYNLGSSGLQSGYYYWNGANWATIATATSAGNGVSAMDMVKLYDGVGNAATINTNGVAFSVPTSGKYAFDFSSSATCGSCTVTLNFQVRDGSNSNAVIGSDMQSSYNNNVHSEYNGKVEVNLTAGRSYNVLVTASAGGIYNNDYTRVYMKQVSGNLPVTGQTVDYVSVSRTGSDQTVNTGSTVVFNTINGGNIPYNTSTGAFSLTSGKTYRLSANISLSIGNTTVSECNVIWKSAAGDLLANKAEVLSSSHSTNAVGNGNVSIIYTPTVNTTVSLYVNYSTSNALLWQNFTFASIEQIGSSAIINPWTLSGTNTYNTTGNVGIGNNAPAQALDVTGTGKFSTSIINSGTRSYFGKDGSNMHWLATTDVVAEPYNLGYGVESSAGILSHRWNTAGVERMRLNSNGYLGIGTSSPSKKLHVQSADATSVYVESTTSDNNGLIVLNANTNQNWSNNWHEFMIFQNQGVNIGYISGASGGSSTVYGTTSDYRLKTDLKNYSGLNLVNKIKTYDYAWKKDNSRMYGVMAHELQSVLPYTVTGEKDAVDTNGKIIPQAVDYSKLTPILVKAVQEQNEQLELQKQQIEWLKKEIRAIKRKQKTRK
jgi:hypothetical protein